VREPETPRPYRVTGYPVVPALFILAALVLLVFSFMDQPRNSIAGAIVILCGVPLHLWFQPRGAQYLRFERGEETKARPELSGG
jgi:APA family basic amino acid/polyamine antiporter